MCAPRNAHTPEKTRAAKRGRARNAHGQNAREKRILFRQINVVRPKKSRLFLSSIERWEFLVAFLLQDPAGKNGFFFAKSVQFDQKRAVSFSPASNAGSFWLLFCFRTLPGKTDSFSPNQCSSTKKEPSLSLQHRTLGVFGCFFASGICIWLN
jgi:hypothetical protein